MVLFFTHIPFVVNHTFHATPPERLQQYLHHYLHLELNLSHRRWSIIRRYYHCY